jgi:SAM-dependent methyltransferase
VGAKPVSSCPLCDSQRSRGFAEDRRRRYLRCASCHLVHVPPRYFLTPEQEKTEYDLHQNDPYDPGYREFLSRLALPLQDRLSAGAQGLDFGCGPGPALALMLRENGYPVSLYDPYYRSDRSVLAHQYDFITATEVVEHLHEPGRELACLWRLIRPGGYLGVMTKLVLDADAFNRWHYKNDPTHVSFFSRETWQWWARQVGAELEILGKDVILLQKPKLS